MFKKASLLVFFLLLLFFCFYLMFHSLSYDSSTSSILVGAKYWSDFGGHLPQIRSFSLGSNWPPEYPLFPGEPIRYHFLFFALVGLLEKAGMRIDYALNLPSALGLFIFLVMLVAVAKKFFNSYLVGFFGVIFSLFNASFSWWEYLQKLNLDLVRAIVELPALTEFVSFAPWNGSQIAAFWNLNIFTNQRHLAMSFAVVLVILCLASSRPSRLTYLVGFLLGFLLFFNQASFAIGAIVVIWYLLVNPLVRRPLVYSVFGFLPWLIASHLLIFATPSLKYHPGFLFHDPWSFGILSYFISNFGLHLILFLPGVLFSPPRARLLAMPLLAVFGVASLFQLSVDIINNHKFYNFFLAVAGLYSAVVIIRAFRVRLVGPAIAVLLSFSLVMGGIVDLPPVLNDRMITLSDIDSQPDAGYIFNSTSPDSVFLNSTWFYHPASLSGRKIFNGYPYFTWSFGYDQIKRESLTASIYSSPSKQFACRLLLDARIDYVELSTNPESFIRPSSIWTKYFSPAYVNQSTGLNIYQVKSNCSDYEI